jgi:succinate dehydrogenase/fumarate reductase cytochrome b subunit
MKVTIKETPEEGHMCAEITCAQPNWISMALILERLSGVWIYFLSFFSIASCCPPLYFIFKESGYLSAFNTFVLCYLFAQKPCGILIFL